MQTQCDRMPDAAAYVLGELHSVRLDEFARHLRTCRICAAEVELLESAADAVPLLASRPPSREEPPPAVRVSKPTLTLDAAVEASQRRSRPRLRAIAGGLASGIGAGGDPPRRLRFMSKPVPKPVLMMFGALAVVAIITTVLIRESNSIRYVPAHIGWKGGDAVVGVEGSHGQLVVERMPAPPAGRVYEIWVLDKGTTALAPTGAYLHLNKRREADVDIPGDVNNLLAVAVYEEPAKGIQTTNSGAVVVADMVPGTVTNGG